MLKVLLKLYENVGSTLLAEFSYRSKVNQVLFCSLVELSSWPEFGFSRPMEISHLKISAF